MANRLKSGLFFLEAPLPSPLSPSSSSLRCDLKVRPAYERVLSQPGFASRGARLVRRTTHARSDKVRGEGYGRGGQRSLAGVFHRQHDQAEPLVHAPLVGQAAPEVAPEDQAAARLASRNRLALSQLR